MESLHARSQMTQNAARISVLVGLLLVTLQLFAYYMTNAMVILASVLESVMDTLASATALFALYTAHRPADHNHRYGHGKAEPLVTMGQAAFVAGSGIYFFFHAFGRLLKPEPISHNSLGVAVMVISTLVIIALLIYQRSVIARTQSMSIKADYLHYLNDVGVNAVVIIALLFGGAGYALWLDPLASMGIALYVLYSAFQLGHSAVGELMDVELPDDERAKISSIILAQQGVVALHDLRTRRSGPLVFIESHIEIPGHMSLLAAHDITDRIELALVEQFPHAHITLHQEPAGLDDARLDNKILQS